MVAHPLLPIIPRPLRVAVPLVGDAFASHFGSAERFALFTGRAGSERPSPERLIPAPAHRPGVLPLLLQEAQTDRVIVSGIGERALILLADAGIEVFLGAAGASPAELAGACVAGVLPRATLRNTRCPGDHKHPHDHDCGHP